ELVDVGEGTAADFARRDLRGKIVLAQGIASPAAAALARDAGAAGQLHASPHEHLHEMCISPVWGSPAPEALANLPSTVAATISKADGEALRQRLAAGKVEVTIEAEVDTAWRKTPILVAELDGPDPDGAFIMLSGHHDTWYEGVMDNGGANASQIEIARVCAAERGRWRRGLRVCFWSGHSHGRYSGSSWYVDQYWDELEHRCAAHINLDSTGGIGATDLTASSTSAELAALVKAAVEAETGQTHAGKRLSRSSDNSFWGVGIPTALGSVSHQPGGAGIFRNALGWWWHTPHDKLDKIDPNHLVRDTRIALRVVWPLLTERVLPLDIAAQLDVLVRELEGLQGKLQDRLPLGPVIEAAIGCRAAASGVTRAGDAQADAVNRALMRVSRLLVPLDYTSGDRFMPDPALPLPAWPSLDKLRAFAASPAGTDAAFHLRVGAVRARNRLMSALHEVRAVLGTAHAG
ncbi:MAG: M28 family peptidase, partial [Acetobacteraceae bacterium]|nr:M28 family peptidase [Acetobacteraceae bacterium]